jgi:TRAP-type C4-dicarboxylate transport system permease small subunit
MLLNNIIHALERAVNPIVQIITYVAAGVLALMMLITAADVLLRYIFNRPISGTWELTSYMMAVVVGFGLSYCALVKGLISVEVLTSRFSPRAQAVFNCITYFFSFLFFSLVTWQSILYIKLIFESNLVSAVLVIPTFPFVAALALGSLVFTLVLLKDFLEYLSQLVTR